MQASGRRADGTKRKFEVGQSGKTSTTVQSILAADRLEVQCHTGDPGRGQANELEYRLTHLESNIQGRKAQALAQAPGLLQTLTISLPFLTSLGQLDT